MECVRVRICVGQGRIHSVAVCCEQHTQEVVDSASHGPFARGGHSGVCLLRSVDCVNPRRLRVELAHEQQRRRRLELNRHPTEVLGGLVPVGVVPEQHQCRSGQLTSLVWLFHTRKECTRPVCERVCGYRDE
jgi:hypothetical protein